MKGTASRSRWEIISSHIFTYFNFLNLCAGRAHPGVRSIQKYVVYGDCHYQCRDRNWTGIKGKTDHRCAVGRYSDKKRDDIKMENFVNVTSNFCGRATLYNFCLEIRSRWTVKS